MYFGFVKPIVLFTKNAFSQLCGFNPSLPAIRLSFFAHNTTRCCILVRVGILETRLGLSLYFLSRYMKRRILQNRPESHGYPISIRLADVL